MEEGSLPDLVAYLMYSPSIWIPAGGAVKAEVDNKVVISSVYHTIPLKSLTPNAQTAATGRLQLYVSAPKQTRRYRYKYTGNTTHPRMIALLVVFLLPPRLFRSSLSFTPDLPFLPDGPT